MTGWVLDGVAREPSEGDTPDRDLNVTSQPRRHLEGRHLGRRERQVPRPQDRNHLESGAAEREPGAQQAARPPPPGAVLQEQGGVRSEKPAQSRAHDRCQMNVPSCEQRG